MESVIDSARGAGIPWNPRTSSAPVRFGCVLMPNFSLLGLGAAVDPLRIANSFAKTPLYEYVTMSELAAPVEASNGVRMAPDFSLTNAPAFDAIFVIGPDAIAETGGVELVAWLRRRAADGVALGGID